MTKAKIRIRRAVYGPEDIGTGADNPTTGSPTPAPTSNATTTTTTTAVAADPRLQEFTPEQQKKFNVLVAEERRKAQGQNQKTIDQLEALKQQANLTEQQKLDLQNQIEQLTSQYQTKEQQQTTELQKLQTKYDTDTKKQKLESDNWKQRFEQNAVGVDIRDASVKYKAINPKQIDALLRPITKVVELVDDAGKPTGELAPRVDFMGKNKEGQITKMQISVEQAVKIMTEMPEEYGNLFETSARSGVGGAGSNGAAQPGSTKVGDLNSLTPQQYKEKRGLIREEIAKHSGANQ